MTARKATRKKTTRKKKQAVRRKVKTLDRDREYVDGRSRFEFDAEMLFRLVRRGNPIEGCASIIGVGESTLHRHIAENPELKAAVEKARADRNDRLLTAMFTNAIRGNATTQIFLAKNWCGLREVRAVELTGADGGPLEINSDLGPIVEDKLDEFIRTRSNGGAD